MSAEPTPARLRTYLTGCPACGCTVHIQRTRPVEVLAALEALEVSAFVQKLTRTELGVLGEMLPLGRRVYGPSVAEALFSGQDNPAHTWRVHVCRIRQKLAGTRLRVASAARGRIGRTGFYWLEVVS